MGGHVRGGYGEWFEHWADARPDALAVIDDDGPTITFGELEERANRLANAIDDLDPARRRPNVVIGLEQGIDAIVAMVAVAKTGRAQVPLDPADPPARLAEVLAPMGASIVLVGAAEEAAFARVPVEHGQRLRIDQLPASAPSERRFREIDPEAPCVIVFTSGTTGRPKAAARSHLGVVEIKSRETEAWYAPGVRHASVADHQWLAGWAGVRKTLCSGGTVVRYSTRRRGPGELARFLAEHRVQVLGAVPSLVRAMLDADPVTPLPDLRYVVFSGDLLHRDLVMRLFDRLAPGALVQTGYGASELGGVAKLTMTSDTVPDGEIVPVGPPNDRVEIEVEDPDAEGVGRLIVISRRGAPAFKGADAGDDSVVGLPDGRWRHRTSDLGLIRPDGLLEIRGRQPHMAKVRGQRIGVGEVEGALLRLPGIADAGVGVHPGDPGGRLAAWVVPTSGAPLLVDEVRRQLRPILPGFMVPAVFVEMTELPRGTRGKLLRDQLPLPGHARPPLGYPYVEPQGPVEPTIAAVFGRVLGIEGVGRDDDLFDLGGDSLHAAEVMTAISAALRRDLPLSVFVEASTPARLAEQLVSAAHAQAGTHLVDLQAEGDRPPVFCVHGGGGQVLSLAGLAERLGPQRPFVGIQMGQGDKPRALFRLNRLAARYAGEIAARQGTSPCVVAGHSYGGVVAQEVSRRLAALGTPVELCILLDAPRPRRRAFAGRHRRARALGDLDDTSTVKELLYAGHAVLGLRPRPHRLITERMIAALWGMSWHRPRTTPVPMVVVRAGTDPTGRGVADWAPFTSARFAVVESPGGHNSMLAPPFVDELARVVAKEIEAVEGGLATA